MAKIVHFGKYYSPDSGGIESVTASLCKGAVIAGHTVAVVCFQKTPTVKKQIIDGVQVIRTAIFKLIASQPLSLSYIFECIKASRNTDIVHLHAPNMLAAMCALFIPKNTCLLVHWHSDVINKGFIGAMLRPLEAAVLRRANGIVVTSQVYAEASKTLNHFKAKTYVVPIGVPDSLVYWKSSQFPAKLDEQIGNKRIILAVGRLVSYKGFHLLIRASQMLPEDAVIVIVGSGPLASELQQNIDFQCVGNRVLLTGRLNDLELNSLFKKATLYCLPSTYRAEAFGVVLLEAMAYGLPLVASNIPGSGVPWVNQHGTTGLNFPVGDVKAMADACNKILASEVLRKKFAQGARQRFLNEFTEEVFVKRMLDTYSKLLNN